VGATAVLPAGSVVVATNVGTTNGAYCALGSVSSTSQQYIGPNGGWFAFTIPPGTNQMTCATSTSTTTVNLIGGFGLATGAVGGSAAGGGGNSSITNWAGSALGQMANYGASPGAVLVPGVNAFVTNSPAVAQSGSWTDHVVGNAGGIFDGATSNSVPANALYIGMNVGGNLTGLTGSANGLKVDGSALAGFSPTSLGTPVSATFAGVTGALPTGAIVVATNVGPTYGAYCNLGPSTSTSAQYIAPNGGWFAFNTALGSATQITCQTPASGNTTTVNLVGGSGSATGAGGSGGSGGGSSSITNWAGGSLGAMANYGSSPGAVLVPGVNANVTNFPSLQTVNGTVSVSGLGSPFQAGGSIGNTSFGISGNLPPFASPPTVNLGTLNGAATAANQVAAGFSAANVGSPVSATFTGVTGTLPSGAVVVATNIGGTYGAYCNLGASTSMSAQYIAPNGGWFAFGNPSGSATQITCQTPASGNTTTINLVGGAGQPAGTGGASGGGGGSSAITTWAGGTLGSMSNFGTSPGAVLVPGENSYVIGNAIEGTTSDPAYNGSNTASLVALGKAELAAQQGSIPAGSAIIGYTSQDPCAYSKKLNASFSTGTSGGSIISGVASQYVYICQIAVSTNTITNFSLIAGTGSTCTSPVVVWGNTSATTASSGFLIGTGTSNPGNGGGVFGTGGSMIGGGSALAANLNVCVLFSTGNSPTVSGTVVYVQTAN